MMILNKCQGNRLDLAGFSVRDSVRYVNCYTHAPHYPVSRFAHYRTVAAYIVGYKYDMPIAPANNHSKQLGPHIYMRTIFLPEFYIISSLHALQRRPRHYMIHLNKKGAESLKLS
jgi:hypothetical protein